MSVCDSTSAVFQLITGTPNVVFEPKAFVVHLRKVMWRCLSLGVNRNAIRGATSPTDDIP